LTPGVIVEDGAVASVDVAEPVLVGAAGPVVPVLPVLPVVPLLPVVCANAGAALNAIVHMRPAPARIGIFRILVNISLVSPFDLLPDRCKASAHLATAAALA
jgi:hypothetical protein